MKTLKILIKKKVASYFFSLFLKGGMCFFPFLEKRYVFLNICKVIHSILLNNDFFISLVFMYKNNVLPKKCIKIMSCVLYFLLYH